MSEPMVFWRDMECSGVSSLTCCQLGYHSMALKRRLHWGTVMGTQEAYAFFRDLGQLEQTHHLEADELFYILEI